MCLASALHGWRRLLGVFPAWDPEPGSLCKASEAEVAQALTGTYREGHLFELQLAYEAWQFSPGQVEKADGQIAPQLGRMKCDRALPPLKPRPRPKRRVNSPGFDFRAALYSVVGLDLTEVGGAAS